MHHQTRIFRRLTKSSTMPYNQVCIPPPFMGRTSLNSRPAFLSYSLAVLVFALVMIYLVVPKYGRTNPYVYISVCSLVGSVSVMAVKGLGVAVRLTFDGNNQFTRPATYVFAVLVAVCIIVQTNYFNKALDTFSTNVYV